MKNLKNVFYYQSPDTSALNILNPYFLLNKVDPPFDRDEDYVTLNWPLVRSFFPEKLKILKGDWTKSLSSEIERGQSPKRRAKNPTGLSEQDGKDIHFFVLVVEAIRGYVTV